MPSPLLYWKEMFGMATRDDRFIYLSDGGHFDNLGLYELLRRRCKYIIVVDGTGEPPGKEPLNFSGLGIAQRLARIDFGVELDMDLRPLMRAPDTGLVDSYFAVSRIRYPADAGLGGGHPTDEDSGVLVYIKLGLVAGTLTPDIINYIRQVNPDFPHDSTADQQFEQAQFESYRQLGFLAGRAVCEGLEDSPNLATHFGNLDQQYKELCEHKP